MSASTTGIPWALKRLETVLFPELMPPVNPTILMLYYSGQIPIENLFAFFFQSGEYRIFRVPGDDLSRWKLNSDNYLNLVENWLIYI